MSKLLLEKYGGGSYLYGDHFTGKAIYLKEVILRQKGRQTQSAMHLWGGDTSSRLSPPQPTTLRTRDPGAERSAASDEDFLSEGARGNEGSCATRSEAHTSQHAENHKETSGEAPCSISDPQVSG